MKRNFASLHIGMALISAFSIPSHADFSLDKLKSLAEQAKVYQEKLNQASSSNVPSQTDLEADEASMQAARSNMDIVGLKIGMSLDEALRILKRHNPKLTVKERLAEIYADADNKSHTWKMFLHEGNKATGSEEFTLIVSLPPRSRIVNIIRVRKYSKAEAPTMTSVLAALLKKYGKENMVRQEEIRNSGGIHEQFFWQVGGRVEKDRPCGANVRVRVGWNFEGDTRNYRDDTRCGLALSAGLTSHLDNSELVHAVSVVVGDFNMAYQDWESSKEYLRNASRVRDKSETEAAKKRSAPVF